MLKKSHEVKLKQHKLFIGLFLFCTFFSFIDILGVINIKIYPEYFIALMVLTISSNLISVSITKVFLVGIIIDIFIGSIMGQYTLTFLILLGFQVATQKYFSISSRMQTIFLRLISVSLGVLIVSMISQKFSPIFYANGSLLNYLIIDIGMTFFIFIIFQIFYERTYGT